MNTLLWVLLIGVGLGWLFRAMSRSGAGGSGHSHEMGGGCCGGHSHQGSQDHAHEKHTSSLRHSGGGKVNEMAIDPVCNMAVESDKVAHTMNYGGTRFSFCSDDCYKKFKSNPESYLVQSRAVS